MTAPGFSRALIHTLLLITVSAALDNNFGIFTRQCVADDGRINLADAKKKGVGYNIGMVEKLLQQSSSAKLIMEKGNDEAKALHKQSLELLDEARIADTEGTVVIAAEKLQQAKKLFFSAVKASGAGLRAKKNDHDFKTRYQHVNAMLEAYNRVREENPATANSKRKAEEISELMASANRLFESGKTDAANKDLESAWLAIRLGLVELRTGKTLVRTLDFASPEEEYHYELDRNKTHFMLVDVLLREKKPGAMQAAAVDKALDKARKLSAQSEQQGKSKQFPEAIKLLEESTQEILRAIRAAGVYIPG